MNARCGPPLPPATHDARVTQQIGNRQGERIGVALGHHHSVSTRGEDLPDRPGVARHDRDPGRHRLQQGGGDAVLVAGGGLHERGDKQVAHREEPQHACVILPALEVHPAPEVELGDPPIELVLVGAAGWAPLVSDPDDVGLDGMTRQTQAMDRLDQVQQSLLRLDATDRHQSVRLAVPGFFACDEGESPAVDAVRLHQDPVGRHVGGECQEFLRIRADVATTRSAWCMCSGTTLSS